jgi:hypothetical protein
MLLALKLALTPVLIIAAALAGRRWGAEPSGWLIGRRLTSGLVNGLSLRSVNLTRRLS